MAVAAAGHLNHHPQLVDVDPTRTASRIERLPWVERATVVRHWPATVEVTVVERTAVVAVPSAAGGWAAVDGSGRVLEAAAAAPAGLVTVTPAGTVAAAPAPGARVGAGIRAAVGVVEALPSTLSGRVTTVRVLADDGQLELVLDAGAVVSFGRPEDVRAKLVALTTLVERTNLKGVRTIDVRVPTAPVLTRA